MKTEWNIFKGGIQQREVDVRDFIQKNYTPYDGNDGLLEGPTRDITELRNQVMEPSKKEQEASRVLNMDIKIISIIMSHGPGYLNKDKETIIGFQTGKPFKYSFQPYDGVHMVMKTYQDDGYEVDPEIVKFFTKHRKTYNTDVFDAYIPEMRTRRFSHIITGLSDAYGCGRITGNYHRIALYGVDALIQEKKKEKGLTRTTIYSDAIRERGKLSEQIRVLEDLKELRNIYRLDVSKPACDVREATQWTYLGYPAAVKKQNEATVSLGRISTFPGIYAERDLKEGRYTEKEAQEFVGHFIIKLRLVKFTRASEHNELFLGDPTRVTESIGGIGINGRHMVIKMSFRYLHALQSLGTAPGLDLTVLRSARFPENFRRLCAKTSIKPSSIQYENDDSMGVTRNDDYAITYCVPSMHIGKKMQFFGVRASLARCLLYAINDGVDEIGGKQAGPKHRPVTTEYLDSGDVMDKYEDMMRWPTRVYVNVLNIIHYDHDEHSYEGPQTALHNKRVARWFTTGIVSPFVIADSLSAIEYVGVETVCNDKGIVADYTVEGDFPKYGNSDDRADRPTADPVYTFTSYIKGSHAYRGDTPTTSILTITSSVVYGDNMGATSDGRKAGQPLAPGTNPMHHRDNRGAVTFLVSMTKLPFRDAQGGISNAFSIILGTLDKDDQISMGDLEVELNDCGSSCEAPILFERLDSEADIKES